MDANAEDAIFGTPLIAAARGGHDAVVAALLRCETVDADRRSQRDTPLTAAASEGHLTSAKLLSVEETVQIEDTHAVIRR